MDMLDTKFCVAAFDFGSIERKAVEVWDLATSDPIAAAMLGLAAALTVIFLLYLVLTKKPRKAKAEEAEEHSTTSSPHLDQFVEKWNATTDWPTKLQATDRRPWFSVEVEKALVGSSTQPLLIVGKLEDIRREKDAYVCEIRPAARLRADLKFELLTSAAQVQSILSGETARVGRFAIAASIDRVYRQRFEALVSGEEIGLGTTHLFIATGKSHDLLYLDG